MAGRQLPWRKSVILAVVMLFSISLVAPLVSYADTNLEVGGTARIAYSNGEDVRLRTSAGRDAEVVAMVPEGAVLDVLEGPITLDDGSFWYKLQWGEFTGFIISDFLALDTGASAPAEEVIQGPAAEVVGFAWVLNTNGEGVRCRVAPDANSALITVVPEGSEVSLTGWASGEWQPVLCADTAGYIHVAFVSYDGSLPVGNAYWGEPVVEEPAPAVEEEPVVEEEAPVEEPATEEAAPVEEEDPAEDVVEETTTEEAPADTDTGSDESTDESATEEPVATDEAEGSDPTEEATDGAVTEGEETPTTEGEIALPEEDSDAESTETPTEEPVQLDPTDTVVGYGIITGTNGDGIRCRTDDAFEAAVITILPEGVTVEIRGATADAAWTPVFCGGKKGFVVATYVVASEKPGTTAGGEEAEGAGGDQIALAAETAKIQVTGTGGGLNCRTKAGTDGAVITVVSDGTTLSVRGSKTGDWLPVVCANRNGYVFASYTKATGTSTSSTAGPSTGVGGTSSVTGTARVSASGDGLRCRQNPNYDGKIITVLADRSTVSLRGDKRGDWQPVFCGGQKGHVFAQYLSYSSSSTSSPGGSSSTAKFAAGSMAVVTGTGGAGVRIRATKSTSGAIVTVVGEGKTVQVTSGSSSTWIAVSYNGNTGFISADYLKPTSSSGTSSNSSGSGTSTTSWRLQIGDKAVTLASVNLRYGSSTSTGVAAVVPTGTVVKITGSPKNGFYPVNWDGLKGYLYTDYLRETNAAVSIRGGSGTTTGSGNGSNNGSTSGGGGGSASGQGIVNYAMQYVGYPYVWATHGPGSFDCSGFTSWVIKNTLGINIGYSVAPQFNFGTGVSRSNLQPGDIVFFENTYTFGLSHVGIYIGNNQFVHAENQNTGVRVSDLNSTYYSTRFYGARRLA